MYDYRLNVTVLVWPWESVTVAVYSVPLPGGREKVSLFPLLARGDCPLMVTV